MSISVEILDGGAVFRYPPEYEFCDRQFDNLLDQRDASEISDKAYLRQLGELTRLYPLFIDGHVHIGIEQLDRGRFKAALKSIEHGFKIGTDALPPDFQGVVEWSHLDNRPFLRAAANLVDCLNALNEDRKAIELMEQMLAWDPEDHLGLRFKIGSMYFRADRKKEARQVFEANAPVYPPYWYELGLYWLELENDRRAATCLRCGFIENPYVAEAVLGVKVRLPLPIWHGSDYSKPHVAQRYMNLFGSDWVGDLDSLEFLRWLHGHPKVLAERAAICECKEALIWETDVAKRQEIFDRENALLSEIDDRLSGEIIEMP